MSSTEGAQYKQTEQKRFLQGNLQDVTGGKFLSWGILILYDVITVTTKSFLIFLKEHICFGQKESLVYTENKTQHTN